MAPRTTVRLRSPGALKELIRLKEMSIRYFAAEVTARGAKCSPGMISHFIADKPRKMTCSAQLGHAIEEALGQPHGFLFAPVVSPKEGQDDVVSRTAA